MKRIIGLAVLCFICVSGVAGGQTQLRHAWAAAEAGDGYDKLVELDSLEVYTGGIFVSVEGGINACIQGHGAILDLMASNIYVSGIGNHLDINGCVIMNGGNLSTGAGLYYDDYGSGHVSNCVFYGNRTGLQMEGVVVADSSSICNCIFMENSEWGAILDDEDTPPLFNCAAWINAAGDYALWCGCDTTDPFDYYPNPADNCLVDDPDFVNPSTDPSTCDFHLNEESPCIGAGDPLGTDIGAYQEWAVPTRPSSWGRIKGMYRGNGSR